jgi:hypothetical protein
LEAVMGNEHGEVLVGVRTLPDIDPKGPRVVDPRLRAQLLDRNADVVDP